MSVEEKLIDIIVEQLSVDRDKVVPKASFVDDLGADSLDLVELIMAMEEAFDTEIPDEPGREDYHCSGRSRSYQFPVRRHIRTATKAVLLPTSFVGIVPLHKFVGGPCGNR